MMAPNEQPGSVARNDPDRQPYHYALSALLTECAETLESSAYAESPNAAAMRVLQENLDELIASNDSPSDIQFAAFLTDTIIADAFKNFFGDALSYEEADRARRDLCRRLARLFAELSDALIAADEPKQNSCFKDYVSDYLGLVRKLNEHWVQQHLRSIGA
jgi:hypothetical protein